MKSPRHICRTCESKIVQQDLFSEYHETITGCKLLTKKTWEQGYSKRSGCSYQHNCPLKKKEKR